MPRHSVSHLCTSSKARENKHVDIKHVDNNLEQETVLSVLKYYRLPFEIMGHYTYDTVAKKTF